MRLDKLLAHTGFGSRKDVKQLLKRKLVFVNNTLTTKGDVQVSPTEDKVVVNGEQIMYQPYVYLMLHKPPGYVSATVDHKDKTVIELLPNHIHHPDISPVGRLDKNTEGLLFLTNDGLLNHRLTAPKHNVKKIYYAMIDGHVQVSHIPLFEKGIILNDGYQSKPSHLHIIKSGEVSEIELTITEGKFHQVKRMFEAIDMKVTYLKRINMGGISLDPELPIGKIRALTTNEINHLQQL